MIERKAGIYEKYIKRLLDFMLSLCAIIVLSPILLILTIVGAIVMRGNPFFTQERPGKDERIFKLVKFRSMDNRKDKEGNLLPDDVRLNRYGRLLRSTSLDELPELFNILKGDMSIVGPRPQLVRDMVFMNDEQRKRHTVRQGLTGLAQINGRNAISWEEKFNWDLKYIENMSFVNDFSIILHTITAVLERRDTVREGTASDLDFGDWLLAEGKISSNAYNKKLMEANQWIERRKECN